MPATMAGQAMTMRPSGPNGSIMGGPPQQPVFTMLSTEQTMPLSQLPEAPMPRTANSAQPNAQTTVVVSTETQPAPKRHWWWPWSGSDN
jgi:hypothetical protein